jgi:hypothetical protein
MKIVQLGANKGDDELAKHIKKNYDKLDPNLSEYNNIINTFSKNSIGLYDFIKSTTEKDAGYNVGNTKTPKQIRKELIEESKNCQ